MVVCDIRCATCISDAGIQFKWSSTRMSSIPVIIEGNRFFWVAGVHSCEEYCRSVFYIKASKDREGKGRAERWLDHPLSFDIFQILRRCIVIEH